MTLEEMAQVERMRRGDNINKNMTINPYSSREITLHNGMRSAITREGDNFEILAQEFGLKAWELRKFNDYPEGYEPTPGEILYLQHKKSRAQGMYELHRVAEGESMHYISQYYGIRMKALYRINKPPPEKEQLTGQPQVRPSCRGRIRIDPRGGRDQGCPPLLPCCRL